MRRVLARRLGRLVVVLGALIALVMPAAMPSAAQDRAQLVRALGDARDFRIRVRAAFALGNTGDENVVPALERALRDRDASVRAAAATALGRLGARRSLAALEHARRDSSAAVRLQASESIRTIERGGDAQVAAAPAARSRETAARFPAITFVPREDAIRWPRVRYVVFLGDMRNRTRFGGDYMTSLLRSQVGEKLSQIRNVAVLSSSSTLDARATREIARRRLPKLRLDGSVLAVQRRADGPEVAVRCEVSLVLLDEPALALRGELRGAATGIEPRRPTRDQDQRLAAQALEGAVRSALADAHHAIRRAATF